MILLEILLFIALIAVIFGVSMHDAFWGIVAFIGGAILASIVILFIKAGAIRVGKKIKYLKSNDGKKAIKKSVLDTLFGLSIFLWLAGPFLVEIIAHTVFKEFADANELPIFLIALSIFIIPPVTIFLHYTTKKRTR